MPDKTILVCTVGGSHQPILNAIQEMRPAHVLFICSGRDPETGRPGSDSQILGKGKVIAGTPGGKPELPNIPTLASLDPNRFEVRLVPADDLDRAFFTVREALLELIGRFPGSRIVADYTGGTKSMTAALVVASLEIDQVDLQLVTGARSDLNRVADRTQYVVAANIERIRLDRAMAPHLAAWRRHFYDETEMALGTLNPPADIELRSRLNKARNLSRAFAAWDRFEHVIALEVLDTYRPVIGRQFSLHLKALKDLTNPDSQRHVPLCINDVWLNARRRALQGRYDDAVGRIYRMIEWTAQWQLEFHAGFSTDDVPEQRIPPEMYLTPNQSGRFQVGLRDAWRLVAAHIEGPARAFIAEQESRLLDHLMIRNHSILAHGFTPIDEAAWRRLEDWMLESFLPMFTKLVRSDAGIRYDLNALQLPVGLDA